GVRGAGRSRHRRIGPPLGPRRGSGRRLVAAGDATGFRTRPFRGARHVPEPLLDPGPADGRQGHAVVALALARGRGRRRLVTGLADQDPRLAAPADRDALGTCELALAKGCRGRLNLGGARCRAFLSGLAVALVRYLD